MNTQLLKPNTKEEIKFSNHAKKLAENLSDIIYDFSRPHEIVEIGHAADADGETSRDVIALSLESAVKFSGNSEVTISSEKRMDIDEATLLDIKKQYPSADAFIFSDLPGIPMDKAKEILGTVFSLDHHPAESYPENVLNPHAFNIPTKHHSSGSTTSDFVMKHLLEPFINQRTRQEIFRSQVYTSSIAITGAAADNTILDEGLNKVVLDFLIQNKAVKEVIFPYFGYFKKPLVSVLAENVAPVNLKYRVSPKAISFLDSLHIKDHSTAQSLANEFRHFFIDDFAGKVGLNEQYFNQLNPAQKKRLDVQLRIATSTDLETLISQKGFLFSGYEDDLRGAQRRQTNSDILLTQYSLKTKDTLSTVSENRVHTDEFRHLVSDNIIAFADPRKVETYLDELKSHQYAFTTNESELMKNLTISEFGNHITALSKREQGDLLFKLLQAEFNNGGKYDPFYQLSYEECSGELKEYSDSIRIGMMQIEDSFDRILEIAPGIYYRDINDLAGLVPKILTMTGVYGGCMCSSKALPSTYGIIFTSAPAGDNLVKISARINPAPGQVVDFGQFYKGLVRKGVAMSGGGHKEASSGRIPLENIDSFYKEAFDTFGGISE